MRLLKYEDIGESIYHGVLSNGLSVYIIPRKGYNRSFACSAVDYGGSDIRFKLDGNWLDTPAGIAHFLEHKMFDMPDGNNALTLLSANGASPNAFTSSGMTVYHFESTDMFEENLRVLLKFVSTAYFTKESVQKEQGIIAQEIRMIEDNPEYCAYVNLMRCLFEKNPISNGVAGTIESISKIDAETLYFCHKAFYNPANMVLCAVGDINPEKIIEIAEEILSPDKGAKAERDYGEESQKAVKQEHEVHMPVSMPLFMIGIKLSAALSGEEYQRDKLKSELLAQLISGRSSPLYGKLYSEGLINDSFVSETDFFPAGSVLIFSGESKDPKRVFEEIKKEIALYASKGADPALFDRVKKSAIGKEIRGLNSFEYMCYNQATGHFKGFEPFTAVRMLTDISAEELRTFAETNMGPERMAISLVKPIEVGNGGQRGE